VIKLCQPVSFHHFARSACTANCATKSETSLLTTLGRPGLAPSDLRLLISLQLYARSVASGIPIFEAYARNDNFLFGSRSSYLDLSLLSQPSMARLSFAAFSGDDQSVVFFGDVLLGSYSFFFDGALLCSFPFFNTIRPCHVVSSVSVPPS